MVIVGNPSVVSLDQKRIRKGAKAPSTRHIFWCSSLRLTLVKGAATRDTLGIAALACLEMIGEKLPWAHHRYFSVSINLQQMLITADDNLCFAGQCACQELVVI